MEFNDVLSKRRSIRKFSDLPVSDEQVNELLYAGTLAPSSKNLQQWGFIVLKSERKDSIASITSDAAKNKKNASSSTEESCRVIREAPILILVYQRISSASIRGDLLSVGACIENICLKAVDMGLGSLCICDIDISEHKIMEELGLAKPIAAAIAVGYPAEAPAQRPRERCDKITDWM